MTRILGVVIILCWSPRLMSAQTHGKIIIEGVFKGKDVYVKNPFAAEGVGFCVYEVRVNGMLSSDEVNSSAFAIDLQQYDFVLGEKVYVEVMHKADCKPEIINAEAIQPESTFETLSISLSPSGMLIWRTKNEQGSLIYRVEQKKWGKWVKVGEVVGEGSSGNHDYHFQADLHQGENTFRVSQQSGSAFRSSDEVRVKSDKNTEVLLEYSKVFKTIDFSAVTSYELFNTYGELVAKGFGDKVDVEFLKKGKYYLNFETFTAVEIDKR